MNGPNTVLPRNQLLIGDVRKRLAELPATSVDTVITSPPYFGLRDYGHRNQLGLEPDVGTWVEALRAVCADVARVLKPTGSLWLNVGDGYSAHPREGAAHKSLLLGPQRLAVALAEDGWIVRNQIVWAKTNPMPSSVSDRLSNKHEIMYLLVRARYYFFDLDPIRVPLRTTQRQSARDPRRQYPPQHAVPSAGVDTNAGLSALKAAGAAGHPLGKNPGDVWEYPTASYHGAHFATFPTSLITPALLATCPKQICTRCGRPWRRALQRRDSDRLLPTGPLQAACGCHADSKPGVVLDPFMGSGTVALVAEQHHRDWVGIEINPVYAALAEQRLAEWRAQNNKQVIKENQ